MDSNGQVGESRGNGRGEAGEFELVKLAAVLQRSELVRLQVPDAQR